MSLRTACAAAVLALAMAAVPASAMSSHCDGPRLYGFHWISLHQSGIGCDSARTLALHYLRHNHITGWSCTHELLPPRRTRFGCFKQADHHQTLAGSWYVD